MVRVCLTHPGCVRQRSPVIVDFVDVNVEFAFVRVAFAEVGRPLQLVFPILTSIAFLEAFD